MRPFAYTVPATLDEAVRALAGAGPGAKVLAGATTLYDLMKLDVETPSSVADVRGLPEPAGIGTRGPGELSFGAGAPMAGVAEDPVLLRDYPAPAESLVEAASRQLRNMATVGGDLLRRTRCGCFRGGPPFACDQRAPGTGCAAIGGPAGGHALLGSSDACIATYPGDWAVALIAFDAVADVAGPGGTRTIPLARLHVEPGGTPHIEHTVAADEIITRIRVPATPLGRGSTYHKIRDRESYAFAPAGARPGAHDAFRAEPGIRTVAEAPWIAGERALR